MTLRAVKKEEYSAEVKNVSGTFNKILRDLSKYLTLCGDEVVEAKKKVFANDDFAGRYNSNSVNFFEIPSINASLRIQGEKKDSGGRTRGGSIEYLSEGEINVDFVYLDGTSNSDLNVIRNSLINSGLEKRV